MKKKIIMIYRIILSIIIIVGIIFNLIGKNYDFNMLLSYYTVQSNIIILVILILEIINSLKKNKTFKDEAFFQNIKGAGTIIILITGIIFTVMLAKYTKDWRGYRLYSSYLLHYISPPLFLIDFLFFDNTTQKIKYNKVIFWLTFPLCYYILGVIRTLFLDGFTPYPFMDVNTLGFAKSLEIVIVLLSIFYLLAILLCVVKNKIERKNYKDN